MHKRKSITATQGGFVSIMVTMIIMILLSLIVLGFAQATRREKRQSVDRQLNSQAQYAAETGINDAQNYIKGELTAGNPINDFKKCGNGPASGGPSNNFDKRSGAYVPSIVSGNTTNSCTLINPSPTELIWQRIATDSSVAFPFNPPGGNNEITVGWQDADSVPTSYSSCTGAVPGLAFTPQSGWACQAGALRIDLTPVSNLDRTALINGTSNFVLYPVTNPNGPISLPGHGDIIAAQCNTANIPRHCKITINGLSGKYVVRIRPIYRAANIYITGNPGNKLSDAQALVDVTGKANDILKRLQARISVNPLEGDTNTTFNYALQSIDSICKRVAIIPPATVINDDPTPAPGDSSCL